MRTTVIAAVLLAGLASCGTDRAREHGQPAVDGEVTQVKRKVTRSDAEWRELLSPQAYEVLRRKGTERAYSGEYWNLKDEGSYLCAGCGTSLFSSKAKFDSGTGWPSFWEPISDDFIDEKEDRSLFMRRTEVLCGVCGGHLGHVFDDGPAPTGLRYCINSVSLTFEPAR